MTIMTEKEFAIAEQAYDESQEDLASQSYLFESDIPGMSAIEKMTPEEIDAVYDKYYDYY